jgi:hypothetical protein
MEWIKDSKKYANGKILKLGKWEVGGVYYDGLRQRDDHLCYAVYCSLPGVKKRFDKNYLTEKEGMEQLEFVIKYWIEKSEIKNILGG